MLEDAWSGREEEGLNPSEEKTEGDRVRETVVKFPTHGKNRRDRTQEPEEGQ
jgi:hypothetical protein